MALTHFLRHLAISYQCREYLWGSIKRETLFNRITRTRYNSYIYDKVAYDCFPNLASSWLKKSDNNLFNIYSKIQRTYTKKGYCMTFSFIINFKYIRTFINKTTPITARPKKYLLITEKSIIQ